MTRPDGLLHREYAAELRVRTEGGAEQRIIEGDVIPYGEIVSVQDDPRGPRYRETIPSGAVAAFDPARIQLESLARSPQGHNTHDGALLVGRGVAAEDGDQSLRMAFRVARTRDGDELLELAREGVLTGLSAVFRPIADRTRPDGVVERTQIELRRVAVVASGAYQGATVTAVRAASEDTDMPEGTPAATTAEDQTDETAEEATETPQGRRPNRTRVTVDVERAERERADAQAEERARAEGVRADVQTFGRAGTGARITRPESVYGPSSTHFFLRDQFRASQGDWEASQRVQKHAGILQEQADALERAAAWDWQTGELRRAGMPVRELARAGEVLSSEIPGAYPTEFVPGLLTPRILKGRPMGDFYDRFPIADARVRQFPKVTTSTTVAVQSAEGAALSATDFATTAVNVTPLMYGAFTDVSRQTIDGADPVAQAMLLQDLNEAYAQASEAVIKTAVEAGSTASGVAITAATPYAGTLANVINYFTVRFRGATGAFIPSALFPVLGAQGDTTGRPFLPMIGATNSDGQILVDDTELALAVLTARAKLSYASTVNVNVFGRPNDFVTFESSIASFSFDQVVGPQAVRIGIWAYLVVGARLGSLKVTAA